MSWRMTRVSQVYCELGFQIHFVSHLVPVLSNIPWHHSWFKRTRFQRAKILGHDLWSANLNSYSVWSNLNFSFSYSILRVPYLAIPRLPDLECCATGGIMHHHCFPNPVVTCDYCCARCSQQCGALFHHPWSIPFTFSCLAQYIEHI